jgi:hypothetical protein
MKTHFDSWRMLAVLLVFALLVSPTGAGVSAKPANQTELTDPVPKERLRSAGGSTVSGIYDNKELNLGTGLTECPQAGFPPEQPKPLDLREPDQVEKISNGGDDRRANSEFSCFPQNETSIAVNPKNQRNIVAGANDYRNGTGSSGFYASTNGGSQFYSGIIPYPSVNPAGTTQGFLVSGGDPALVFDRAGIVYYAQIAFNRDDDTNAVTVQRSTNGGFTWSRACIVQGTATACGGPGDPRQPGDGVVSFQQDNDSSPNGSIPFDDKEYIAAGPRPSGVSPQCFTAAHVATACDPAKVGVDRIYVTWTKFTATDANIMLSYSDDQARSWSPAKVISGSAPFCAFGVGNNCDFNQFSTPTVHPVTGLLGVAFENFNTPDENQYLFVRSSDGGNTFQGPFFVTPVFDLNFPRAGVSNRQDCTARGQQSGRIVYTNSCFRSNPGGNVVVDKRGGDFADDFYLVMSDNRNGTVISSNADIFLFKSIDGGSTWIGPTRVNNDRSQLTAGTDILGNTGRDCLRPPGSIGFGTIPPALTQVCAGDFGNDQWWPWVDISDRGDLNIVFNDRRLDLNSTAHEWAPASRQRPGNYLVWFWGAQCSINASNATECMAPGATTIPQPTAPFDPGADPVPGQGDAFLGPLRNFTISDVPSNYDYSFRAGIFAGDYNNVTIGPDRQAWAFWTDARNGRSSRTQTGRNPLCEQADVFVDGYSSQSGGSEDKPKQTDALFLVTLCPAQAVDK